MTVCIKIIMGAWCMVYGVWCMVYGAWCMVVDVTCMYSQWLINSIAAKAPFHIMCCPT
jgi:hypothetical protein